MSIACCGIQFTEDGSIGDITIYDTEYQIEVELWNAKRRLPAPNMGSILKEVLK